MKKISYSVILLMTFLLIFSCKKNESTDLLVGKWYLDSIQYVLYENGVLSESETSSDQFEYLEFTAGGKFYVYSTEGLEETADWKRKGSILTLIYDVDDEEELTILTLDNTTLIAEMDDTYQIWREVITVYMTRGN